MRRPRRMATMSEHRFALFLGCTVSVRGFNYELSTRKVFSKLGIEIVDIPGFSCCGFPIDSVHHHSAMAVAVRNLALAEAEGVDILTLCSACTGHLTKAAKYYADGNHKEELKKVNEELADMGYEYKGNVKVKHFSRFLFEGIGLDKVKEAVTEPLTGLKVAPHYGCHYIKPSELFDGFDSPYFPESLDKLIEITGAESISYKDKLQCCGGGILAVSENTSMDMVKQKLDHLKEVEADALIVICPFCDIMYDEYQPTIGAKADVKYDIPVLYYTQLLGLAMGFHPRKDLAVNKNQVKVKPLLKKIETLRGGG